MSCLRNAICAPVTLLLLAVPVQAVPTITLFQIPGAAATFPTSITNSGEVLGYSYDGAGYSHGFIRAPDGTLTTLDIDGSPSTTPRAENEKGTIVGYYSASPPGGALIRSADGTITTFSVWRHRRKGLTWPTAVNAAGWIAIDGGGEAFLRDPYGQITDLGSWNGAGNIPTSINSSNFLVGYVKYSYPTYGWLRTPDGSTSTLDFVPYAINDANIIAGYADDYPSIGVCRFSDGKEVYFKGPRSYYYGDTEVLGLNNEGIAVGYYNDFYKRHAFIWPCKSGPVIGWVNIDVPGASDTLASRINDNGVVIGTYNMPDGVQGAFIRTP